MVNVLIADDNIFFAKKMMDYINTYENIKVSNIAVDGKETLDILNNRDDIDIFLLDLKMPIYDGIQILDMISAEKRMKYKQSCIIISGEINMIQKLMKNEMVSNILYKSMSMSYIMEKILKVIEEKQYEKECNNLLKAITNEVLYLGYNISHKGTVYLIETIYYIRTHSNNKIRSLKEDVYPYIAKKNKETPHNVKCNIARATEQMYYNCEINRLQEYMKYQLNTKPNLKMIINSIIQKIK